MSSDNSIDLIKAVQLFKDYPKLVIDDWSDDNKLEISEIKDEFFKKAPLELMSKVAEAFKCNALIGKKYTREELIKCINTSDKEEVHETTVSKPFTNIVGKKSFEDALAKADKSKPVYILVWSRNCIHCTHQKPEIVKTAQENANKATFIAMEFPFPPGLAYTELRELLPNTFISDPNEGLGLTGLPTLYEFRYVNGEWQHTIVKQENKETLGTALKKKF